MLSDYQKKAIGEISAKVKPDTGETVILLTGAGEATKEAAAALSNNLGRDVFEVDLSLITTKFIGETEKNLKKVFAEAKQRDSILVLDEADALFGKRTDVKDAHDRFANIEVNYLLQRIEEYGGVVILATNHPKNIESAFRLRCHVI